MRQQHGGTGRRHGVATGSGARRHHGTGRRQAVKGGSEIECVCVHPSHARLFTLPMEEECEDGRYAAAANHKNVDIARKEGGLASKVETIYMR